MSQGPGAFNSSNFYANDGPYGHFIFGRWNIFISKAISKNLQTGNSSRWFGESIGKSEKFSTKNSKRKFWFRKRNFSRCFWRNFWSLPSQTKDSGIRGLKIQCDNVARLTALVGTPLSILLRFIKQQDESLANKNFEINDLKKWFLNLCTLRIIAINLNGI